MDLIICFCILFIGSLLFWEFSKNLLIEAVENLIPVKVPNISHLHTNPHDNNNKTMVIQQKINEVIVSLNKVNKEEAENEKYKKDEDDEPVARAGYVPIKELDLSLINGKNNELLALQTTLNNLIDKLESDIHPADISKILSRPKKIYHIITKLNEVITASNDHIEHIYENRKKEIGAAEEDAKKNGQKADEATQDNVATLNLIKNGQK